MLALTKYRLELGMSMNQFAIFAGVSPQTLQQQEKGKTKNLYPNTAKRITEALGVSLWDVYECRHNGVLVCKEVE